MKIGTHSGSFHCDEALACFMLKQLPTYKNAEIVRSRDPKVHETMDIVVDVGAVYDAEKNLFDHHQRGFAETLDDKHTTKLSSAGLVYKHFGLDVIKAMAPSLSDKDAQIAYDKIYTDLIEGVDGIDNGISQYPSDLTPAYKVKSDLGCRVARLNPAWNEESDDADKDQRFVKAMEITGEEFTSNLNNIVKAWFPARKIVQEALNKRYEVNATGEILVLHTYTMWKSHLHDLEEEKATPIKYVLYPDSGKKWRVQCVPVTPGSFVSRKPLPEVWRGIRNEALSELSGIPGCVFVHAGGFIGGNETYEGALKMASTALTMTEPSKKQKI